MAHDDATYGRLIAAAKCRGAEDGRAAAASYVADLFARPTPDEQDVETARTILEAVEASEESVLINLPWCDLSGQWADVPSAPEMYAAIASSVGVDPDEDEDGASVLDSYEEAYNLAMVEAVAGRARAIVGPEPA